MTKKVALRLGIFVFILAAGIACSSCGMVCNPAGGSGGVIGPIERANRAHRQGPLLTPAATVTCPVGGGGGGSTCTKGLKPNNVLFTQDINGNILTYALDASGNLTLMCNPTLASAPGELAVSNNNFLYVLDTTGSQIFGFLIAHANTGALTAVTGLKFPVAPALDFTAHIIADPLGRFVFVTDATGNAIHVFAITAGTGTLAEVTNSPFKFTGGFVLSPDYLAVTNAGNFVYAVDSTQGQIAIFSLDVNGQLVQTASSPVKISSGTQDFPHFAAVHPTGKFLFTANGSTVAAYSINTANGDIAAAGASPFATAASFAPETLVVDNTGGFLYVDDLNSAGLIGYPIDTTTGALQGLVPGSPAAAQTIDGLTANPVGAQLYILTESSGLDDLAVRVAINANGSLVAPTGTSTAVSDAFNIVIANVQ